VKKAIQILFILVYLLPGVGLTVAYHFCGDNLVSSTVVTTTSEKEPSDCCGEGQEEDTCCHTQFKSYKLDDLHFASAKIELNELTFDAADYAETTNNYLFASQNPIHSTLETHSPPGNDTYLLNRVLLI
jgi:hypothetical protein